MNAKNQLPSWGAALALLLACRLAVAAEPGCPPLPIAPFDAGDAGRHQEAWAEHVGGAVEIANSVGMKMRLIPPGEFLMGSSDFDTSAYGEEKPQHLVRITKPFYLNATEVTQQQYECVMGMNPSYFKGDRLPASYFDGAMLPVEQVSWNDAMEFCRKLTASSGEQSVGRVYRLPTEAEWEYACRAGTTTKWSFGDDESALGEHAWCYYSANHTTHPVGQMRPNAWGLFDMHGSVEEWCSDWWVGGYASRAVSDPIGPTEGSYRMHRGGSWRLDASRCRSAARAMDSPGYRSNRLGFRVACSVNPSSR